MTANQPLHEITAELRKVLSPKFGDGEAKAIIRLIFHHLKGWNATDMVINEARPISDVTVSRIGEIVDRLMKDEPIQYIVGEAYFYGMDLDVAPGVLIPRPETEELVDRIVKDNGVSDLHVLDVGTGSGCIAIALARNLPFPVVDAVDISEKALDIAKGNARKLKAAVNFSRQDIFKFTSDSASLDIIVSNPPYIDESEKVSMEANVLDYEPHEALFVPDDDPLKYYKRIAAIGIEALKPGGKLYFEINPRHASELKSMLQRMGYEDVEISLDIHGKQRFITARKS